MEDNMRKIMCIRLGHFAAQQKLAQHCKSFKKNFLIKKTKKEIITHGHNLFKNILLIQPVTAVQVTETYLRASCSLQGTGVHLSPDLVHVTSTIMAAPWRTDHPWLHQDPPSGAAAVTGHSGMRITFTHKRKAGQTLTAA